MNWNYISGFFDADGYLTLIRDRKDKPRVPTVGFTNNKLEILESIQDFILSETSLKGAICKKRPKKEGQEPGYDLKYPHCPKVLEIMSRMTSSIHPKKQKRYQIIKQIYKLTPRNGKYTQQMLDNRNILEEEFLKTL